MHRSDDLHSYIMGGESAVGTRARGRGLGLGEMAAVLAVDVDEGGAVGVVRVQDDPQDVLPCRSVA